MEKVARPTKTPKGTRDYGPLQMKVRERVISTIGSIFKRHGAVAIDTPVFELKEVLLGNYGEDSKLIYDLADQGGEQLALRYDLTVPFARYIAANGLETMKRYHIAKVYRRDNPVMTKGRYREFYQCDYDIAGTFDPMIPDAECIKVLTEILDALQVGSYIVKVNHRKLLDGIFSYCGVEDKDIRTVSSSVDKLDKAPWGEIKDELVNTKKISEGVVDKIGYFMSLKGEFMELLAILKEKKLNEKVLHGVQDMELLNVYLKYFGVQNKVKLDLSLARGLDYYTGMVLEAVLLDADKVGSISGGGRYDNLVDAFIPGKLIPAVGFSVGIERIFAILDEKADKESHRMSETDVLVATIGAETLQERFTICSELWAKNLKTEFLYIVEPKLKKQLDYANHHKIPLVVIVGSDEVKSGMCKLKIMATGEEVMISRDKLVDKVTSLMKV